MVKKRYVIDTNVLLNDPKALFAFEDNDVCIHAKVIDELEKHKSGNKEININSRRTNRYLDELLVGYQGGSIPINEGKGELHFIMPDKEYSHADPALIDYLEEQKESDNKPILVTEDVALRVKARIKGHQTDVYMHEREARTLHGLLKLVEEIALPYKNTEELRKNYETTLSASEFEEKFPDLELHNNQYLHLKGDALALRYKTQGVEHKFVNVTRVAGNRNNMVSGIIPRNKEQQYLLDMCLNDEIEIGTALGKAGTGKTLVSLAAGLHQVVKEKKFKRMVIIRPVARIGEDLGFLPGDLEQKMDPYMRAIGDAAEIIFGNQMRRKFADDGMDSNGLDYLISEGLVSLETPTFLQGRSIPNSYIIVDEAQNHTRETIKAIITRNGENSKMILSGDPYQVTIPYIDETNNGLSLATKAFLGQDIFSTVVLKKGA